jgi:hypothetical protein
VRYIKNRRYHKSDVKFFRIYAGVHDLQQIVQQLEQLEEIQTSIELARFHHLKGVTVQIPDSLGHDHGHTLLINGHDKNSKALMNVVIEERDRLRSTLLKKIKELEKHGTTQLDPVGVTKELAEVATMRARGAHFAPLPPAVTTDSEERTVHNKTDDFNFYFAGEEAEDE